MKGKINMHIQIVEKDEQGNFYNEILEMLTAADDEFVPPLSARSSTTQQDLSATCQCANGVLEYFEQLKNQRFMVAHENGKLLAFVSFKENFVNAEIQDTQLPNIYISTLIVKPEGRGRGLTYKMYEKLFAEYARSNIFTRTWSTNHAHIKILTKFGFETLTVLKNHRGEGVDTIYFKKSLCLPIS
jgi:ribosomal protein S18 acetylase RimI-like enzyme